MAPKRRQAHPSPGATRSSPRGTDPSPPASAPASRGGSPPTHSPLRVAFLHPDLGLGGAERLVVDAAVGLATRGHSVTMFTSHYEPQRAFAETREGLFGVRVAGDWLPRHLCGYLHILFAILRSVWLAMYVALQPDAYDVFVCDQVAAYVPVLRWLRPSTRVVFYIHFPDQLLSRRTSLLKRMYRVPFDAFEGWATAQAHAAAVNSKFTLGVCRQAFPGLASRQLEVLYPCVALPPPASVSALPRSCPTVLLSINRFERKKEIQLAVSGFAALLRHLKRLGAAAPGSSSGSTGENHEAADDVHLVVAGGYDVRVSENVEYYDELVRLARSEGLMEDLAADAAAGHSAARGHSRGLSSTGRGGRHGGGGTVSPLGVALEEVFPLRDAALPPLPYAQVEAGAHITFVRSFSDEQKAALLRAAAAVVYTPSNEHFGIVPLECMAARRPVIACASGGPLESIEDGVTGFLCAPEAGAFAAAMGLIVGDAGKARGMGAAGAARVAARFSREAFTGQLEALCRVPADAAAE